MTSLLALELALRGASAGILALIAIALLRADSSRSMRLSGASFCMAVASYAFVSSTALGSALGILQPVAMFAALGAIGYCWLFVVALFEDRTFSWPSLAPPAILTLIGLVAPGAPRLTNSIMVFHNTLEISLALHALAIIHRSWRGDLVETRRRLRGPLMSLVAGYAILVSSVEIADSLGFQGLCQGLVGAAALSVLSVAGGATFLVARTALFGAAVSGNAPALPETDAADRITLSLLEGAMQREVWRQEALSIGGLALEVGVPEHVLRRLINGRLGHRNFAAYINAHRIEAAKRILADPSRARSAVAPIAFELGFGSLGPFNRAFREATGQTPSQWRAGALDKALSDS